MKTPNRITLVVVTAEQTREFTFYDVKGSPAEKQAKHWTKVWEGAGHTVTRK
jgi:hypothetical protein